MDDMQTNNIQSMPLLMPNYPGFIIFTSTGPFCPTHYHCSLTSNNWPIPFPAANGQYTLGDINYPSDEGTALAAAIVGGKPLCSLMEYWIWDVVRMPTPYRPMMMTKHWQLVVQHQCMVTLIQLVPCILNTLECLQDCCRCGSLCKSMTLAIVQLWEQSIIWQL